MNGRPRPAGPKRPVLVIGANGSLMAAIAGHLARLHPLLLHVHERHDRLGPLVKSGHRLLPGDLSVPGGVEYLALQVRESAPDGLAGIVHGASLFVRTPMDTPPERFAAAVRDVLSLDLAVPLELVHALHGLVEDGGRIVLLTDAGVRRGWPSYAAYTAAKAGLEAAIRSLAHALGPRLTVFGLAPGLVEGSAPWPPSLASDGTALGRAAHPDEVARALLGAWKLPVTALQGTVLAVDGGLGPSR